MSKTTRTSKKQIHELEAMARETIDKSARLYARNEYDATGKAYAVINGTRTAYASNTALYDAVAETVLTKQAEEFQSEPEPIIYATERTEATEATENAAHLADLAEQAAHDVETAATICDADAYDNRAQMYAAAAADEATRYDADDATERHAARAARAAEQARAALTARVNAGLTDADTAAALNSDYARTLTNEAIEKAGADPAAIVNEAMNEATEATNDANDAEHLATAAAIEYDADAAAASAARARRAAIRAEQAASKAAAAAEPRPTYQRAELLAYLGEPDDYDVTAIEHDATAYDAATGRTVWAVDAETLAVIAERHQLQFYAPAF